MSEVSNELCKNVNCPFIGKDLGFVIEHLNMESHEGNCLKVTERDFKTLLSLGSKGSMSTMLLHITDACMKEQNVENEG